MGMSTEAEHTVGQEWQAEVFRVLKAHNVKHVVFVPDAGHSAAIRMAYADPDIKAVVLTTEEEGIGYLAGRGARRTLDAVQWRRKLHQYTGASSVRRFPAVDGRHPARRLG